MIKIYKANSTISISVMLSITDSVHISFIPLSNGSSVFQTADEKLQKAMEAHRFFNSMFRLEKTIDNTAPATANRVLRKAAPAKTAAEPQSETPQTETPQTEEVNNEAPQLRTVKVTDLASAKDYVADTFGVSRTSLRSAKQIKEAAAANGVEFEGI